MSLSRCCSPHESADTGTCTRKNHFADDYRPPASSGKHLSHTHCGFGVPCPSQTPTDAHKHWETSFRAEKVHKFQLKPTCESNGEHQKLFVVHHRRVHIRERTHDHQNHGRRNAKFACIAVSANQRAVSPTNALFFKPFTSS